MDISGKRTFIVICMLVVTLAVGCVLRSTPVAPAPTAAPSAVVPSAAATIAAAPSAAAPGAAAPGAGAENFRDPFAYCAGVGTIHKADARYSGPPLPEAVVQGLMKATGASPDMPAEVFSRGTVWRCMDGQLYACFVGANLPCESKADTNPQPSAEMDAFCQANPTAELIPAAVTGHETIYAWGCKDGKAFKGRQVFEVDGQGYIREIWYPIAP